MASVGYNIDCVTTQHTPKYVENCAENKLSNNCLSNYYQIFCKLGYTCNSENSVFFLTVDKLFYNEPLFSMCNCALPVTLQKTTDLYC